MSEPAAYEVRAGRARLLRALLTGRPMRCAGGEVRGPLRPAGLRAKPSPEVMAQVRWGLEHIDRTYVGGRPG
jgi:hypothetical protein